MTAREYKFLTSESADAICHFCNKHFWSGAMNEAEAKSAAILNYKNKYPNDASVEAVGYIERAFGGSLVAIRAMEGECKTEEVIYIDSKDNVLMFKDTEDLIFFLQKKSKMWIVDLISNQSFVTGAVFISLIVFIFILGLMGDGRFGKEPLAALSSVLGAAAGFYFSSKKA